MTRAWWILLLLLPGCTSEEPTPTEPVTPEPAAPEPDTGALPAWEPGRSWTYRTDGYWDATDSITIIAVPDGDAWLLAGSSPDDLIDEVAWDHWHFGPVDLSAREGVLIAFPLEDGATWTLHGRTMVARAANITWSGGVEPGFRATDGEGLLVEYAPSAGFVTRFESRDAEDGLRFGLELTAMGMATSWTSVQVLAQGVASGASAQDVLDVPAQVDEVIAWMLSEEGSSNYVVPPPGGPQARTFDGRGGHDFDVARFAGAEGAWLYGGGGMGEDTYMQLHAVEWIEGTIRV